MPEYISRAAAINKIMENIVHQDSHDVNLHNIGLRKAMGTIDSLPAADVVEVRHGRWIKDDETGEPICSVCYSGKPTRAVCSSVIEHKLNNHEIRYCYYCGAKMDGGQDDER